MTQSRHQKTIAKKMHGPSAYLIRKSKVAILIGMTLVLWGVLSTISIPKESDPYIAFGIVNISTVFSGASAIDIDTLITQEIEDKVKNVNGINKYKSVSRNSVSSITIEFEPGQNMTKALGDIRSKVDEAKPFLPTEINDDPAVVEIDSSIEPFSSIVLSGDVSPLILTDFAEKLKDTLENVPDVALVSISGEKEREIVVEVNRQKIDSLHISLPEITSAISRSHKDTPLGDFEIDDFNYSLRFEGKHKTIEDVEEIILKDAGKNGVPSLISIGDIAQVFEREEDTDGITRFVQVKEKVVPLESPGEKVKYFFSQTGKGILTGKIGAIVPSVILLFFFLMIVFSIKIEKCTLPRWIPVSAFFLFLFFWFILSPNRIEFESTLKTPQKAVEISVSRKSRSDILKVDKRTLETSKKFAAENLPENITMEFSRNMADIMRDDYRQVITSGLQSVVIVMLFIFLFVGVMEGLVASIVIPITFLVTIGILGFLGKTLNFMTNFSMILSLGILVDTAIVIVEGAHHFIRQGYSRREAALLTVHEYGGPLLAGTLTTLAVFIPLLSLSGILGQYLSFIPQTVIIVLICSLLISLLLVPVYASKLLPQLSDTSRQIPTPKHFNSLRRFSKCFRRMVDSGIDQIKEKYNLTLRKALQKRTTRLAILGAVIFLFFASFKIPIEFILFPQSDQPFLSIEVELPEGAVLQKTSRVAAEVEKVIMKYPEVLFVQTNISGKSATIFIELLTITEREGKNLRTSIELEKSFFQETDTIAEAYGASIRARSAQNGPPSEFPVGFRIVARDREKIDDAKTLAVSLTELLKTIPYTTGVKNNIEEIPGEFRFHVDQKKSIALGVNPDAIAEVIRTALLGTTAATITRDARDIDIVVEVSASDIQTLEDIQELRIYSSANDPIPLKELVDMEQKDALAAVYRHDGDIVFTVSSLLSEGGNAEKITNAFLEKVGSDAIHIPDGIDIINAGENEENADLMADLGRGFVIAVMLMFLILVVQFNAYIQPILILFTILFAQIGVSLGLYLTGTPRSLAYILGVIALAGIVVNDAIIMVDQMNKNKIKSPDNSTLRVAPQTGQENYESQKDSNKNSLISAIADAGISRFIPVVLTTLTTSAGIIPLIFQDEFWAGLSYTVIFGLMVASALTLFITPVTFYQFETEKGLTFLFLLIAVLGTNGFFSLLGGSFMSGMILLIIALFFYWVFQKLSAKKQTQTMIL